MAMHDNCNIFVEVPCWHRHIS